MFTLQNNCLWGEPPEQKLAVVLLGGCPPQDGALLQYVAEAPYLAAADAGAAIALNAGRTPDLLIGDFDSLGAEALAACRAGGAEVLTLPVMKDLTDGEFLLQTLAGRGFKRLLVLGALGGRPDQELANIFCAEALAERGIDCLLAHDNALLLPLAAGETPVKLRLAGFQGSTMSMLSLSEACAHIRLAGFLYPLDGALHRRQTLGLSNLVQAETAEITLTAGNLLAVINR